MGILQNRLVAIILCAVMVMGASFVGSGISLRTLRAQSEAVFELGGLQRDLSEIAAQSYNVTVIAGRYMPQNSPDVALVLQKRDDLINNAATPGKKSLVAGELTGAVTALRHTLEMLDLSDSDRDMLQKCKVNIDSRLSTIDNSRYNESAASFNRALGSFPANFLGPLTGVTPLELYK